jgi:hypothetical protein
MKAGGRNFCPQPPVPSILFLKVRTALDAIDRYEPPADRAPLKVFVAETNSKDYSEGGWSGGNTIGHALVAFETFGRVMRDPRVMADMLWTTRWMNDSEAPNSQ